MAETYPPEMAVGLTSTEAAARLGISERTLRERIKSGKIRAVKMFNPNGNAMYRVFLDDAPEAEKVNPSETVGDPPEMDKHPPVMEELTPEAGVSLPVAELSSLAVVVDRMGQELTRLNDERAELYGRLGYFQAQLEVARGQLQVAQARILELEAPENSAPAEGSNHPTNFENAADSGSPEVSARAWWQFWRWYQS